MNFYDIFKLIRLNISLLVVLSAFFGFIITDEPFQLNLIYILIAVLLHSFGNSIINQFQEQNIDALMERTKNRPLVTLKFDPKKTLIAGIFLLIVSILIPFFLKKYVISFIFALNIIIYHLIYTPLKKRSSFALLIGSICGSLPPIIGYLVVEQTFSVKIVFVAVLFYMWQVPHFLFLTEKYKDDYKGAKIKSLINEASEKSYRMISNLWLISYLCLLIVAVGFLLKSNFLIFTLIFMEIISVLLIFSNSKRPIFKFNIVNLTIVLFIFFYLFERVFLF